MKVTITQEYLHRFIPKRCHKERAERKETTFSVTIREVDTKDAPVAFIVRKYGDFPSIVRLVNGKLYRNNFDYNTRYIYKDANRLNYERLKHDLIPLSEVDFSRLLRTEWGYPTLSEEEVKTKCRNKAHQYIIVDGQLYQRTGEPFYQGVTFGLGRNHGGCGIFVGFMPTKRPRYGEMYPISYSATQRTEAIKEILMVAIRRGDTESYNHLLRGGNGDIQVLIPEACKFNFEPLHKDRYNAKYPPSQEDWGTLKSLGEPVPYDASVSDVLNEEDYKRTEDYISAILNNN